MLFGRAAPPKRAGAAALLLAACCGALLLAQGGRGGPRRAELTTYMPASLRWPGWVDAFDRPAAAGAPPPPAEARPELVGAPTDWRDNINYGFHPDEARVPEDEAQDAMQTLINAAGGGETVPAAEAQQQARRQRVQSQRITQARVEASKGASQQQLAKILHPCEAHPSDLRCSEYPTGNAEQLHAGACAMCAMPPREGACAVRVGKVCLPRMQLCSRCSLMPTVAHAHRVAHPRVRQGQVRPEHQGPERCHPQRGGIGGGHRRPAPERTGERIRLRGAVSDCKL